MMRLVLYITALSYSKIFNFKRYSNINKAFNWQKGDRPYGSDSEDKV